VATKRPSFAKRQREQAAKAKAAAKRDRRLSRAADDTEETDAAAPTATQVEMGEVLARVDALQERLERGAISYEEFDEQKAALLRLLPIE
jgi:polyhydroxyalkanoate synthesis regulator phasin